LRETSDREFTVRIDGPGDDCDSRTPVLLLAVDDGSVDDLIETVSVRVQVNASMQIVVFVKAIVKELLLELCLGFSGCAASANAVVRHVDDGGWCHPQRETEESS
jgi:Na+-translocating ferredoxin:NAD+ oxidoreductase RNF subunit RnfB